MAWYGYCGYLKNVVIKKNGCTRDNDKKKYNNAQLTYLNNEQWRIVKTR